MRKVKEIFDKIKSNKKILIPIISIALLLVLIAGVSLAVFNYSNDNAGNNDINSGHISMTYTEPSNEYVVENALPMKDGEGVNSTNYFEFSVTTTAPTNDTDDNGVSIPYEITITESEDNTLTSEQVKMYLTEVEGEKEVVNTSPTLVSNLEDSIYKNEGTKVGFNLHLHRNGNETIATKYRLRAWVDYNVDVSDWDTTGKYEYKFRVNVNGEATYQGYETDQSCFAYEENANGNYSITGYDFSKCDSKNIVVPTIGSKMVMVKEILSINWADDATFIEINKEMMLSDGFCEEYTTETGKEDWAGCVQYNGYTDENEFNQEILKQYSEIKTEYSFLNDWVGDNYYDHLDEIEDYNLKEVFSLGILVLETAEDEEIMVDKKIDEIKSFANANVTAVSNEKDLNKVNDLNNVVGKYKTNSLTIANTTPVINGLIVPEGIEIANDAFSTIEINQLIDRRGKFPNTCYVYNSNNNLVTINDYKCHGVRNLRIPSIIDGMSVTTIGDSAFEKNQLISVEIPDSVTHIGTSAFAKNQLTSVEIPNSVTYLSGFQGNQLTSIKIPDGVTYIGNFAFSGNQLTSVIIPNSVTSIGSSAFYNNQLTSVVIPDNVVNISSLVFSNNKLTSVEIPDGVTYIGGSAFENNKLTSVTIPDGVTEIEGSAFANNRLVNVNIPDSVTEIESFVFANNRLVNVDIPNSVTTIGGSAFEYNQLTSVEIPDSVILLYDKAFANNKLISVTVGNGVKSILGSPFYKDSSSNPGLIKILNKGRKFFAWSSIINNDGNNKTFEKGTVTNEYGNVEIVTE